ncbi:homeodomain-interacting protein kinase 2-like [Acanthopagrus latus]|uniref:homeodomain-interacting protein kinase 2-like n=1 Tax=Acanthopagrus latus TaxID=8177 RepID=UPI00187C07E6|nr:homeodomain-interacting protein kinase 2-like [Acanthopagrus latus]XP_036935255.1 homeodomain-interacting protein kinase 2-like [Acanthopagrus latus]XP_036935256.1 homeodomain-interacting protein kinase 2-like [Acanthopagrus latus]XP_036935257.1 homeodomain-interacting protein kinase 2-like [Acanthopagrus latus]XP_036935258.1 homeodomain-interacting protein kinase 2-like [Acanthopagrus latus]XP_036935259.1 homeodomain-interacting protein kinase 2-like [Acanthopagrus latus]
MDMWALGCVLFQMFAGILPFRDSDEYGMVSRMVELLGMPSNHLLTKCKKAGTYFTKTSTGDWRIKSPEEYYKRPPQTRWQPSTCLDNLKEMRRGKDNRTVAVEQRQCIELLKAMMTFDANERITPREILNHPFITKVYPKVQTSIKSCASTRPAAPLNNKARSNIRPGNCTPSPATAKISVRPVSAKNTKLLEGQERTVSKPTAAPLEDEASSNIRLGDCTPSPDILTAAEISVRQPRTRHCLTIRRFQLVLSLD